MQVLLAIAVLSLLLLVGLLLVSRDAPSAQQLDSVSLTTAGVTGEEGCANFANFWMEESGIDLPSDVIYGLSNCRLSAEGMWFVPASATDPRLQDDERLSADEQAAVAVLSAQLADDLAALELVLPRSLRESLKANYEAEQSPVFGHTKRGRTDLGAKWARYVRVTQAFLLSPQRSVAADYVGWLMERRLTAVESFETHCFADPDDRFLAIACNGLRQEFGIQRIPLYWDLTDPVLIQEYLVDRVRSGEPLPAVQPSTIQ
jgi:hypothetical protein